MDVLTTSGNILPFISQSCSDGRQSNIAVLFSSNTTAVFKDSRVQSAYSISNYYTK